MKIPRDPKLTLDSVNTVEVCLDSALALIFKGHGFVGFTEFDKLLENMPPYFVAVVSLNKVGEDVNDPKDRIDLTKAIIKELINYGRGWWYQDFIFRTSSYDCIVPQDIEKAVQVLMEKNRSLFGLEVD